MIFSDNMVTGLLGNQNFRWFGKVQQGFLLCLFCLTLSYIPTIVAADTIKLKTGQVIDGTIKNRTATQITVYTGSADITLQMNQIEQIIEGESQSGKIIESLRQLIIQGQLRQYQNELRALDKTQLSSSQMQQIKLLQYEAEKKGKEIDQIDRETAAKAAEMSNHMQNAQAILTLERAIRQYPFLHESRRMLIKISKERGKKSDALKMTADLILYYPEEEYAANAGALYDLCIDEALNSSTSGDTYIYLAAATRGCFRGEKITSAQWLNKWEPIFRRMLNYTQSGRVNTKDPDYLKISALSLDIIIGEREKNSGLNWVYDLILAHNVESSIQEALAYNQQDRDRIVCVVIAQQYKQIQECLKAYKYPEALNHLLNIRMLAKQIDLTSWGNDPFTGITIASKSDSDAFSNLSEAEKIKGSIALLDTLPVGEDFKIYASNRLLELNPADESVHKTLIAKIGAHLNQIEKQLRSGENPMNLMKSLQGLKTSLPESFKITQIQQQTSALESLLKSESDTYQAYDQFQKKYANTLKTIENIQSLKLELASIDQKFGQTSQKNQFGKLGDQLNRDLSQLEQQKYVADVEEKRIREQQLRLAAEAEEKRIAEEQKFAVEAKKNIEKGEKISVEEDKRVNTTRTSIGSSRGNKISMALFTVVALVAIVLAVLAAFSENGIDRLVYFLGPMVADIILGLFGFAMDGILGVAIKLTVFIILFSLVTAARLRNIGWSGWWSLLNIIPIVGFILSILCFCLPPGYANSRRVDRTGIILFVLFGIVIVGTIIAILAAIAVPNFLEAQARAMKQ